MKGSDNSDIAVAFEGLGDNTSQNFLLEVNMAVGDDNSDEEPFFHRILRSGSVQNSVCKWT